MSTGVTAEQIEDFAYKLPPKLPSGEWAALRPMLYSTGLFLGIVAVGCRTRWCYERTDDVITALAAWDGQGDPPGLWVKQKPEDRLNPAWAKATPERTL